VLQNPPRRLLRKPALARAADVYRNSGHILILAGDVLRLS
jgi:hypothetical protein